jgi:hypothetical protein
MRGDLVEPEFANSRIALYRPPMNIKAKASKGRRKSGIPRIQQSPIWLLITQNRDYDEVDEAAEAKAIKQAVPRLKDDARYRVETIAWSARLPIQIGDRIICVDNTGRSRLVEPPARAIAVVRYEGRRGRQRTMISIEVRKYLRPKRVSAVRTQLGSQADDLARVFQSKKLRSPELLYNLGKLWPTS